MSRRLFDQFHRLDNVKSNKTDAAEVLDSNIAMFEHLLRGIFVAPDLDTFAVGFHAGTIEYHYLLVDVRAHLLKQLPWYSLRRGFQFDRFFNTSSATTHMSS